MFCIKTTQCREYSEIFAADFAGVSDCWDMGNPDGLTQETSF